jgi:hypothetical protein
MTARLKLIENTGGPPRPLGKHGMALWRSIMAEFQIDDAAGIELLTLACQALDRSEACRRRIDKDGEVSVVEGRPVREHPLLKSELANRSFVTKTIERLGLNSEAPKLNGRPAGSFRVSHEKTTAKAS